MNEKEQQRRLSRDTSLIPIIRELYDDEMILDANPHVKGIKAKCTKFKLFCNSKY